MGPIKFWAVNCLFNWLQVSVCKQQHGRVFVCRACRLRRFHRLPKNLLKGGESRNQAVLPIFVGHERVLLLFAWEILARRLTYPRRIYSEGVTRCGSRQLQWAWRNCLAETLHSITCFGILRPKNPLLSSENKLVFRCSNQQKHVVLCWQNDGSNPKLFRLFYLFFHDAFEWRNNENNNIRTISTSFAVA